MVILGINISGFHSSACLIIDGKIKAAITEERLSRVRRDKNFPHRAISYCCELASISLEEITDVYIGWNPAFYMGKSDNTLQDALQNRGKLSYLALNELALLADPQSLEIKQQIKSLNSNWKIHYLNHHFAHLSNSFINSGFSSSDFCVMDGFGEHTTGMVGVIDYEKPFPFQSFRSPHSLGSFYSTFTEFLGFHPNGDEWKVMALASLGDPAKHYDKIKKLIVIEDLNLELDLSYFEHYLPFTDNYFSPKFEKTFGPPLKQLKQLTQNHYDLVASVQKVAEETVIKLLKNLHNKTGASKIVLSGGFFMNSVLNGKVLQQTPYENVYIGGSPDDSGISIGSALYGLVYDKGIKEIHPRNLENYYGGEFSTEQIVTELDKRKIKYKIIPEIETFAAAKIRDKKIIGWFQGRSEFGQRALGNRSILADPTCAKIKDMVNSSIKYREGFRPFAPSVIEEKQHDFFINEENQKSFFMEKVLLFKEEFRKSLGAVVHFDGSGRLQTVSSEINPKYHKLICEFEKLSGFPIILNTSFNINGMPLVETPSDAIECFYKSGIDYLIMNNVVVEK